MSKDSFVPLPLDLLMDGPLLLPLEHTGVPTTYVLQNILSPWYAGMDNGEVDEHLHDDSVWVQRHYNKP